MKTWIQPAAIVEKFVANEYVAACWSVSCQVPYESDRGWDPFKPGDTGNLHRKDHCGAEDGFEVITDENGNATDLIHVKAGSTNNTISLKTNIYWDESFTSERDISTVTPGETIYFTTVNGGRTWYHHGEVKANHS